MSETDHFSGCEGAGFVGAQDGNASERLNSGKVLDENIVLGHAASNDREREGHTYRKALRAMNKLGSSRHKPIHTCGTNAVRHPIELIIAVDMVANPG